MDKIDYETKTLQRAENLIRTVLVNDVKTDVSGLLPLLGFSDAEEALTAADRFGVEARLTFSPKRAAAVIDAKAVVSSLPPTVLAAFDRKVKRASDSGE